MAEGFEAFHVPQQSRRDKLRVVAHSHHSRNTQPPGSFNVLESSTNLHGVGVGVLPLYDPSSFISCASDLLTAPEFHAANKGNPVCVGKEEGSNPNFMGFVAGIINASSSSSSSSSSSANVYLDPQSSLPLNPTTVQVIESNPFLYNAQSLQGLRDFDQSYSGCGGGDQVVVFKPEPLSLSLSSHNTSLQPNLPLELNLQRYGSAIYGENSKVHNGVNFIIPGNVGGASNTGSASSNHVDAARGSVPLGPFTGYASVLKSSRFLKPAHQLLEELCDVGYRAIYVEKIAPDASLMEPTPASQPESSCSSRIADDPYGSSDGGDGRRKKSRLLSMLDEVYRRYRQYYQQMQAVVTSFECVSGLGNAAPYANLAIKAMSKHFRCLKNAIMEQLQFTYKPHFHTSQREDDSPRFGNPDRGLYSQRTVHNSTYLDHQPIWRPQRGLPERAVTVLRAWLFEHFLHPYPTDTDKLMLAKQTGLSRSQVSNWFINARVRLWKPMVEEIHMLETRQVQKNSQREEQSIHRLDDHLPSPNSLISENPSTSMDRVQDGPSKRTRSALPDMPARNQEAVNLPCNNLSSNEHMGIAMGMGAGNSGVSLTLGLHQNHGIGLSEPFPISAAQRFGLAIEPNNEGYVMGAFESQNRRFGRDVIGGQLLHDFVG